MSINIDKQLAAKILLWAFKNPDKTEDNLTEKIKFVLHGTHKTYKYILVNGLLAKAVNSKANPLTLQAGASLPGAFDARSLCHQVLVPFERKYLKNGLGGSNEPFLNKPARFTDLSSKNAVRGGNDKIALAAVIKILGSVKHSKQAKKYLAYCLHSINEVLNELDKIHKIQNELNPTATDIYRFIVIFLENSFEGETCTLVVATLEKLFYTYYDTAFEVRPHKINQSGASSKEILDIDVYKNSRLIYGIEVKDKNFTKHDVEHALKKSVESGGTKAQFIFGPRAKCNEDEVFEIIQKYEENGFFVLFENIFRYSRFVLSKVELTKRDEFLKLLMQTAVQINSKTETKKWIKEVAKKC